MYLLLLASALAAEPEPPKHAIDVALSACMDTSEGSTTLGMIQCTDTATKAWDVELNKAYKALMAQLEPDNATALKEAQRAWIAYRDADIKAIYGMLGQQDGTLWRITAAGRVLDLTESRARQLMDRSEELKVSQ